MTERILHHDVVVMQPGYMPWLGYFDLACLADDFVIYDDVQFDKGGWRNRNRILNGAGPLWLTVPIVHRHPQEIRNVRIADTVWQAKHLRSIAQLYRRAPCFDEVFPMISRYLNGKRYDWLVDLCVTGHRVFCDLLGVVGRMHLSSELDIPKSGRTERLVEICRRFGASRYVSPDASAAYMGQDLWTAAGIELVYQRYPHPRYRQWETEFVSHLSIVDALMFAGVTAVRGWTGISHGKVRDGV